MSRRERRYLERAERALYVALAAHDARAVAAAVTRLDAIEPQDEEDRRMRARLLAMAHSRVTVPHTPVTPVTAAGLKVDSWMFCDPPASGGISPLP